MPPYRYIAPSGGGGGADPDLGWRRFLLDDTDIVKSDPQSQEGSLSENATYTHWTAASSVTISGSHGGKPQMGCCYARPLLDANGDALNLQDSWTVEFYLETLTARADLTTPAQKIYYGLGITDSTSSGTPAGSDLSSANQIGCTSRWVKDGSSGQSNNRWRKNGHENAGDCNRNWDVFCTIHRGPRRQAGTSFALVSHRFDPSDTTLGQLNPHTFTAGSYPLDSTGPAYVFASCGITDTFSSDTREIKFRIWYKVTGGGAWPT
jgi:hypothetical protein